MKVVGITGRSGCGKSGLTAFLREQGLPCVDADAVARALLQPGAPGYPAVAQRLESVFGCDILDGDGALRRRLLAQRAFADPQATRALNEITHPAIFAALKAEIDRAAADGAELFFLDGAVIVGTVFRPLCDVLVVVTAPTQTSVRRICARDGISAAAARQRLAAQLPQETLCAAADYILPNDGTLPQLRQKAMELLAALRAAP